MNAHASAATHNKDQAAKKLHVGTQVKVYRGSGGTREVTIKSIDKNSGKVEVQWHEGTDVWHKTVDAAEIVAMNVAKSQAASHKDQAARKLHVGTQVKVYRGSGGTREAIIESIDKNSGKVEVQWHEGPAVWHKTVDAAKIVALNGY